ncbi:hypothetical protein B0H10DRAFT_1966453 [Mycena sp. CBHHK59/15]|nr:hypothetical protein B0H10DRAFT_1966453 [Mycena sp. CBHHK59/15]
MHHKAKHTLFFHVTASLTSCRHANGGMSDLNQTEPGRFCTFCNKFVKFGKGGKGNWTNHEKSQNHIDAVKTAGKARQITSFFGTKTVRTEQAGTSRGSSSSAAASSSRIGTASAPTPNGNSARIIDVDLVDNSGMDSDIAPLPIDLDPRGVMLRQLRLAISTLPLSIPLATATDLIATFAVDPVTLVGPGQDAWEDVIHDIFDVLMYDEGRSRNTLQLSHKGQPPLKFATQGRKSELTASGPSLPY